MLISKSNEELWKCNTRQKKGSCFKGKPPRLLYMFRADQYRSQASFTGTSTWNRSRRSWILVYVRWVTLCVNICQFGALDSKLVHAECARINAWAIKGKKMSFEAHQETVNIYKWEARFPWLKNVNKHVLVCKSESGLNFGVISWLSFVLAKRVYVLATETRHWKQIVMRLKVFD